MSRVAPKEDFPLLEKPERRHIGVLLERRAYLRDRVRTATPQAASYHREEIDALSWVIRMLERRFGREAA